MLPEPPRRPQPGPFYLHHVPEFWNAALSGVTLPPFRFDLEVTITRDGGIAHQFTVSVKSVHVAVREGPADDALARITFDIETFRVATRDLWPRAAQRIQARLRQARQRIERALRGVEPSAFLAGIGRLSGTLDVRYTDQAGDQTTTNVVIGSGDGRHARVQATDADLTLFLEGRSHLTQLLNSRATVVGDAGWVLRLLKHLSPT
ncbi:hypothetical protein ACFL6C_08345 [Myxococcota bacterium]